VQGNTRRDGRKKPEGLRAEVPGSAEHWWSEVDCGFIYRDCKVVMNAPSILPPDIGVTATGYCNAIHPPAVVIRTFFREASRMFEGAQGLGGNNEYRLVALRLEL
jgi:hypothetical protein